MKIIVQDKSGNAYNYPLARDGTGLRTVTFIEINANVFRRCFVRFSVIFMCSLFNLLMLLIYYL